ncbi:MAG: diguanylate cyclase [Burkholderiales bacterium]|nr:diguanylate cyclase [Burkholderiales bacterium]
MRISPEFGTPGAYAFDVLAAPSLLCALIVFVTGVAILLHEHYSRVGWLHFGLSSAIGVWQLGLAFAIVSVAPSAGRWWCYATTFAAIFITAFQFHFAVTLAGRSVKRERAVVLVWLVTAVLIGLLIGTSTFVQEPHRYWWGWYSWYGPAGFAFIALTVGVACAAAFLYWKLYRSHPRDSIVARRSRLLLGALLVGSGGGFDFLPTLGVDVFPIGGVLLMLGNVINAWTTWRYRLVEITPAFAAQRFMDTMSDGVLVLDQDGVVRLVNAAGCGMLGYRAEELLHAVPPAGLGVLLFGHEELPHFPSVGFMGQERQYQTPAGNRRTLSVSVSLMREGGREPLAAVVTLRDITAAMAAQEQIHKLAYYDPLTNLPNRLLLKERFSQAMARAERARGQAAVLFLDLDRFKQVNDTLGHEAGDLLLKAVSERITACVRESDLVMRNAESAKDSTLARLGGDEFVLLLSPVERGEDAAKVARRILQALAQPFRLAGGMEVMSGVSIGISLYPADGEDADTLMKKADLAMYHAKESGRNTSRFFNEEMNSISMQRFGMETSLRRAMSGHEFLLYYQPVIELASGKVSGLDAQLYWNHPQHGMMSERDFQLVAQDAGLAGALGDWVIRTACFQMRAWEGAGVAHLRLSVSVSPALLERGNVVETVRESLAQTRLDPSRLLLCMREPGLRADRDKVASVMQSLDAMGVTLVLDDFGSGQVSVEDLATYPIGMVRLRGGHLRTSPLGGDAAVIAGALVGLVHGLGFEAMASGADDAAATAFLRELGCDHVLGGHLAPAVPAEEIPPLLAAFVGRRSQDTT